LSSGHDSRHFRSTFPEPTAEGFRSATWKPAVEAGTTPAVELVHDTLLAALRSAARLSEKTGITLLADDEDEPAEQRSYRRLYQEAKSLGQALSAQGVLKGDRVLLVAPTSFDFIVTLFALQSIGAIAVPSYPPAALERVETGLARLAHISNHAKVAWCVTTAKLRAVVGDLALRVPTLRKLFTVDRLLKHAPEPDDRATLRAIYTPRPRDPALIQYTSGSTGNPKGVLLTHANVTSNVHCIGLAMHISRDDAVASWLPLYHDMGLIGAMFFSVYWRLKLVLMSPTAFLLRPARWLHAISEHRLTLSPAPNFAFALCTKRVRAGDRKDLDLSSWRLALNGAEPVNEATMRAFLEAFEPYGFRERALFPVYGLAESTVASTFPRPGTPLLFERVDRAALADGRVVASEGETSTSIACVGRALPGHEVVIADEHGAPLGDGEVGHVLVRGPSVMQGYFLDADASARVLRDGWLWTGDLGYARDGDLFVTGRAKDLIILRGRNYYAEDIERVAETIEGVRHGGVVAFAIYDDEAARDLVIAVCETKVLVDADEKPMAEKIIETVSQACELTIDEVVFVKPGTIPKTSSGKRQRALTRERYLADDLVPHKTGRVGILNVFARSAAGLLVLMGRRARTRRSEPP
jgi:acyl-CoA synthetase (AMP-forming)/AMP-acid ligase II